MGDRRFSDWVHLKSILDDASGFMVFVPGAGLATATLLDRSWMSRASFAVLVLIGLVIRTATVVVHGRMSKREAKRVAAVIAETEARRVFWTGDDHG